MKHEIILEIGDEVEESITGDVYVITSISECNIEIKLGTALPKLVLMHNLIEQFKILKNKTEREKMKDFFFQSNLKDSIIIQKGLCPDCFKKGISSEWSFFRSAKVCSKCDWHH